MSYLEDFEVAKHAISCINSTSLAVLSTMDRKEGIWGSPVPFTHDEDFNFYVVASRRSRHVRDIASVQGVSLVVLMSPNIAGGAQVGLQVYGKASIVPEKETGTLFAGKFKAVIGDGIDYFNQRGAQMIKNEGGVFFKIEPQSIIYLDRRYYGLASKKVPIKMLIRLNKFVQ